MTDLHQEVTAEAMRAQVPEYWRGDKDIFAPVLYPTDTVEQRREALSAYHKAFTRVFEARANGSAQATLYKEGHDKAVEVFNLLQGSNGTLIEIESPLQSDRDRFVDLCLRYTASSMLAAYLGTHPSETAIRLPETPGHQRIGEFDMLTVDCLALADDAARRHPLVAAEYTFSLI